MSESAKKNPLDRFLDLFADVRAGEGITAVILAANVFLLLTAYYLLKVAREPLILMGGGAEVKSYATAGQSVLLIGVAAAYGALARRVDRLRLITTVSLFFASNLVLFAFLGYRHVPLGVPFYLWVGCFSLTVLAQFWAFAADVYTEEQGKRLFPILGIGSSVGAVAGSWLAKKAIKLGPYGLMLLSGSILVGCLALTFIVHRRSEATDTKAKAEAEKPLGGEGGFRLLLKDRYLLFVGALAFILNAVNTSGEYMLDKSLLSEAAADAVKAGLTTEQFIGAFKAKYFAYVNVIGVALQLFATSRIIKYIGVRRTLFIMPVVSGLLYGGVAFAPLLGLVLITKIVENSLDYSVENTARQALWLPTSREAKYKTKQVVDSFLVRAGDVMSAALVWVGSRLAFQVRHYAIASVLMVAAWILVLAGLAREHAKRVPDDTKTAKS